MSTVQLLDVVRLHEPIRKELEKAFGKALTTGQFIGGAAVTEFEQQLAEHVGVSHAIAVSSGTDALLAALMALRVQPGDEVITTPYTFFATAGCIARLGATPVFVDIEPDSFNIDPNQVRQAIGPKTVGIIPVHLFGRCAEMDPLLAIAKQNDLWVLEDAAQAIGAQTQNRQAGTMGQVGIYSFFPAKNLGCLGDGGAIVTNDDELAKTMRALKTHGAEAKYHHRLVGGNFRLDAIQAAFLSVKLPHLLAWEEGRRAVAKGYRTALANLDGITLPQEQPETRHVYNQFVVRLKKRDTVQAALKQGGVACAVYYPVPLHLQECFAGLGYKEGSMPVSERAAKETLAIPIDPLLRDREQERVIQIIKESV